MMMKPFPEIGQRRRALTLAVIIVLQALCAIFFIIDVVVDLIEGGKLDNLHSILEAIAAVALSSGVLYLMRELRVLLNRIDALNVGIRAARGEMASLMDAFFNQWALTPSEREVALLLLKGLDNEDIARLRGRAIGTVRAQTTHIYAKANVDGRSQLMSIFMEELLNVEGVG